MVVIVVLGVVCDVDLFSEVSVVVGLEYYFVIVIVFIGVGVD